MTTTPPRPHALGELLALTHTMRRREIARHHRWVRRHPEARTIELDEAHLRMEHALSCIEDELRHIIAAHRDLHRLRTHPADDRSQP